MSIYNLNVWYSIKFRNAFPIGLESVSSTEENYNCHLVCKKEGVRKKRLYFDIEQFAKDFLESVSFYETELEKKQNKTLRSNFINAFNEQYKPLDIKSHSKPWLSSDDFLILG